MLVEICDLCYMESEKRFAVARYWDADENEHVICSRCLKLVKQAGLVFELLEDDNGD